MHHRHFLTQAAALGLLPAAARAYSAEDYSPGLWREVRDTDQVVIVNFRASWSLTCQIKADILAELVAADARYAGLTFVDVDWDTFGPSEWVKRLKVERRSTLLVMKNGKELARLVNEPYARRIRALLDQAVSA